MLSSRLNRRGSRWTDQRLGANSLFRTRQHFNNIKEVKWIKSQYECSWSWSTSIRKTSPILNAPLIFPFLPSLSSIEIIPTLAFVWFNVAAKEAACQMILLSNSRVHWQINFVFWKNMSSLIMRFVYINCKWILIKYPQQSPGANSYHFQAKN